MAYAWWWFTAHYSVQASDNDDDTAALAPVGSYHQMTERHWALLHTTTGAASSDLVAVAPRSADTAGDSISTSTPAATVGDSDAVTATGSVASTSTKAPASGSKATTGDSAQQEGTRIEQHGRSLRRLRRRLVWLREGTMASIIFVCALLFAHAVRSMA